MHQSRDCPNCEYIIDIHFEQDITHLWTRTRSGELRHHKLLYHPIIYVAADEDYSQHTSSANRSLDQIERELWTLEPVIDIQRVTRYLDSQAESYVTVLKVKVYSPHVLPDLADFLRIQRYNCFNVDINKRQQFFLDTKSFPMAACHIIATRPAPEQMILLNYDFPRGVKELKAIEMNDDQNAIDFPLPPIKIIALEPDIDKKGAFPTNSDKLRRLIMRYRYLFEENEELVLEGSEAEILLKLMEQLKIHDPDLLIIPNGDKFVLNYLAHRAAYNYLTEEFYLGRLPLPMYPKKQEKGQTYMVYGQIMHRDPITYIPGRVHLDYENSFLLYEADIWGLVTLCRLSGTPPERASRASIGTVLTGIEYLVNTKTVPETLIPPNKAMGEQFKPAEGLLIADNGGLTYPAVPGVYDRVWAIDYTSMYPFIITKHNIGNETVLCHHEDCRDKNVVPEVKYHICSKKIGVVPRTLASVLEKRVRLKLLKKNPEVSEKRRALYKGVDSALKWILVASFGYLGFKNARWGSIESHQCVTAYGRRYLLMAQEICDRHGFDAIAGLTDSLFIRARDPKDDTQEKINRIIYEISYESGIPMDLEGKFTWVVFCNVKDYHDVAALNRYFGYFAHDEFKLRGIRTRQRSCTTLERDFQAAVLEHLKHAKSVKEFKYLLPSAAKILYQWQTRLRKNQIDARDLVLSIQSHVGSGNYQSRTQQAQAAQTYLDEGNDVQPGQKLKYIVRNDKRRDASRITIGPLVEARSEYDAEWYCKLLEKAFLELTEAAQMQFYERIKYSSTALEKTIEDWFAES